MKKGFIFRLREYTSRVANGFEVKIIYKGEVSEKEKDMISQWILPESENSLINRIETNMQLVWVKSLRGELTQFEGKRV